jgi:hypothetical protein
VNIRFPLPSECAAALPSVATASVGLTGVRGGGE